MNICGAEVLVANLKAQGVKYVFGVPGSKIDRVFDALLNSRIETVVCRHEQNASFIAAGLSAVAKARQAQAARRQSAARCAAKARRKAARQRQRGRCCKAARRACARGGRRRCRGASGAAAQRSGRQQKQASCMYT